MENKMRLSVLNLVPKFETETYYDAIERAADLALAVEKLDYYRYWVTEHHNFSGVASSATDLLLQHFIQKTTKIRIGAGGVMMPNHAPLQVAERYGTLETLYPKRIDLGVARAPGTDPESAKRIYRQRPVTRPAFTQDVRELLQLLGSKVEQGSVQAYPGVETYVPVYILGSSINSAYVAAELGLPYSFAGHLVPQDTKEALEIYRSNFKASAYLDKPYFILGVLANAAESRQEAQEFYTVTQQAYIAMTRGIHQDYQNPNPNLLKQLTSAEKILLETRMGINLLGNPTDIQAQWDELKEIYQPDELIIVSYFPELEQLKTSYQIIRESIQ